MAHMSLSNPSADARLALGWLVKLRWGAFIGQLAAIAGAMAMTEVPLALGPLFALVGATAVSNIGLQWRARRAASPRLVFVVLAGDAALLTGLLLAAGGPMNPFSVFYLVSVALAGVLLGARGAWALAGITTLGFALLFILPSGPMDLHSQHMHASPLHLYGMGFAYALAAAFVAYFVSGIASALRRRDAEITELRARTGRTERLAALATFSTHAAHELGSPLATIAVAAAELERTATQDTPALASLVEDARLVRVEVERCRGILRELGERGGAPSGEAPGHVAVATILHELGERLGPKLAARLDVTTAGSVPATVVVPVAGLGQALANLVRNALDASPPEARVRLEVRHAPTAPSPGAPPSGGRILFDVSDHGAGFAPEVLAQFGEPFVTTRPGEGLGLGLYLARTFAESIGGTLAAHAAAPGPGSVVRLAVPSNVLEGSHA